jgi:hypothetical protein
MEAIRRASIHLMAALVMWLASAQIGRAQVFAPTPIADALPGEWRTPLAQFLRDFGAKDVDLLLDATRTQADYLAGALLLRLEHKSACVQELCLTMIAQRKDQIVQPLAMFFAGKWTTTGDLFVTCSALRFRLRSSSSRRGLHRMR